MTMNGYSVTKMSPYLFEELKKRVTDPQGESDREVLALKINNFLKNMDHDSPADLDLVYSTGVEFGNYDMFEEYFDKSKDSFMYSGVHPRILVLFRSGYARLRKKENKVVKEKNRGIAINGTNVGKKVESYDNRVALGQKPIKEEYYDPDNPTPTMDVYLIENYFFDDEFEVWHTYGTSKKDIIEILVNTFEEYINDNKR